MRGNIEPVWVSIFHHSISVTQFPSFITHHLSLIFSHSFGNITFIFITQFFHTIHGSHTCQPVQFFFFFFSFSTQLTEANIKKKKKKKNPNSHPRKRKRKKEKEKEQPMPTQKKKKIERPNQEKKKKSQKVVKSYGCGSHMCV